MALSFIHLGSKLQLHDKITSLRQGLQHSLPCLWINVVKLKIFSFFKLAKFQSSSYAYVVKGGTSSSQNGFNDIAITCANPFQKSASNLGFARKLSIVKLTLEKVVQERTSIYTLPFGWGGTYVGYWKKYAPATLYYISSPDGGAHRGPLLSGSGERHLRQNRIIITNASQQERLGQFLWTHSDFLLVLWPWRCSAFKSESVPCVVYHW